MSEPPPPDRSLVRLSKFLSLVLRHHPERIGLHVDPAGWADVEELLDRAKRGDVDMTQDLLAEVVERNDKKRFELSPDGRRIRASHGHSLPVDLGLAPTAPPDRLYHGTSRRALESIREHGLVPRGRTHLHLSEDETAALAVGRRHGQPAVLTVHAREMDRDGHVFYRSSSGVWLTAAVPAPYLVFPSTG